MCPRLLSLLPRGDAIVSAFRHLPGTHGCCPCPRGAPSPAVCHPRDSPVTWGTGSSRSSSQPRMPTAHMALSAFPKLWEIRGSSTCGGDILSQRRGMEGSAPSPRPVFLLPVLLFHSPANTLISQVGLGRVHPSQELHTPPAFTPAAPDLALLLLLSSSTPPLQGAARTPPSAAHPLPPPQLLLVLLPARTCPRAWTTVILLTVGLGSGRSPSPSAAVPRRDRDTVLAAVPE